MSLRDIFKRYLPEHRTIREHRHIRLFGERLHDHALWHLTRRSVSGGVAIGLLCAFIPFFGQMLAAAALAIYFRVNLPVAAVFTWVSNPLTFAPLAFLAYRIGSWFLGQPLHYTQFHLSYDGLLAVLSEIWLPVLLGNLVLGMILATVGYYGTHLLWRLLLLQKRDERRIKRPFMRRSDRKQD